MYFALAQYIKNGGLAHGSFRAVVSCLKYYLLATRMALVGQVDGKEDIASYKERVELYFAANYVEADYEVAAFLALTGADAYGVLRNLLAPKLPNDKSFD